MERWKRPTAEERFWEKVEKTPGCWLWCAYVANTGYGSVHWAGRPRGAHRVSYELTVGQIPEGMHLLHSCDNRLCVNPAHLRPGTIAENNRDMVAKGRNGRGTARGEQSPNAKLTNAVVVSMRRMHRDGANAAELGRQFGVSHHVAWKAATRRSWRHLP